MKKHNINRLQSEYEKHYDSLNCNDKQLLSSYFLELDNHLALSKKHNRQIKQDIENLIVFYLNQGISVEEILKRIDLMNLDGFYARPSSMWLSMDDVAKMYSLFMGRSEMGVFRVSATLKEQVIPEVLQVALLFTVKRFPSFAVNIKKGVFWHYLDSVKRRFKIEEENRIPCEPIKLSLTGSQTFRVIYYQNRISLEVFHGMTDGTGALEFLKVLVKEYLVLLGFYIPSSDEVLDINETPNHFELENSFRNLKLNGKTNTLVNKPAIQIGGKLSNKKPSRIIHLLMSTDNLREVTKRYNTTITSYMISVIMLAARSSIDEVKGEITICFPINLRKHFESKTLRNFSLFSSVRTNIESLTSVKDILPYVSNAVKEAQTEESLINSLSSTVGITQKIGFIPLFLKQPIIKIGYRFLGDQQFTTSLSNLGQVNLPSEMLEHIDKMDFVLGTAVTNRAVSSMISANGITNLSISKLTKDPSFEEHIYKILTSDGIQVTAEGSESYDN